MLLQLKMKLQMSCGANVIRRKCHVAQMSTAQMTRRKCHAAQMSTAQMSSGASVT
jgi:hypothetical protein